jgi:hypothetical protein
VVLSPHVAVMVEGMGMSAVAIVTVVKVRERQLQGLV